MRRGPSNAPMRLLAGAIVLTGASAVARQLDPRADSKIQWGPCDATVVNTTLSSECADFTVPLDYTTPNSKETIKLQIARIKAKVQPAKGTILLNFGGPGQDGRSELASQAPLLQALSGQSYDLAAFDPRGTAKTIPEICYTTPQENTDFVNSQKTWYDANATAMSMMWSRATEDAKTCYKANNKTQPFLGTGSVARDLISVADALGEDGMLRYWGFSYGTTLGATVAAMFPDRIDKLVIDGVQNPHQYYHAAADFEEWTDSDRVFSELFISCVKAGSKLCPIAGGNYTASQLEDAAWTMLDGLKENPIQVKGNPPIDYATMHGLFSYAVYGPSGWPALTSMLALIAANKTDTPEFIQLYQTLTSELIVTIKTYPALFAIHGADKTVRITEFADYKPVQQKLSGISKVMGGSSTTEVMTSLQWKSNAVGPYTGNFHVKTKNPILVANNKYDGHTPLRSAQNVSSGFEGSGMLVVNAFGHTTLAQPSECTIKKTSAYWLKGTLPPNGFVCEVDAPPYANYTWANTLQAVYGQPNGSNQANGSGTASPTGSSNPSASPSHSVTAGASHFSYALSTVALAIVSVFVFLF